MTHSNFLKSSELKELFNAEKKEKLKEFEENGFKKALESLSLALQELRDAKINAKMNIQARTTEEALTFAFKNSGEKNCSVTSSAILQICSDEYLVSFSTKNENEGNILKMYVSSLEYSNKNLNGDYRAQIYDLKEDPKAIENFQKWILGVAAKHETIHDHDPCNSFVNKRSTKRKGLLKKKTFQLQEKVKP